MGPGHARSAAVTCSHGRVIISSSSTVEGKLVMIPVGLWLQKRLD